MSIEHLRRYVGDDLSATDLLEFEQSFFDDATTIIGLGEFADDGRLLASREAVFAEIDTPAPARTERFIRRLGMSAATARLVGATPAFRRSFTVAIILLLLFSAATANSAEGTNRLLNFLTLAPALPLLGTALAFGPSTDPMHEVTLSTPIQGFRLILIRTSAVYIASMAVLIPGSILVSEIGPWRWAWLIPGLALTTAALALSTRVASHIAAASVGVVWLAVVTGVALSTSDDVVMFRGQGQLAFLAATLIFAVVTYMRRDRFEHVGLS